MTCRLVLAALCLGACAYDYDGLLDGAGQGGSPGATSATTSASSGSVATTASTASVATSTATSGGGEATSAGGGGADAQGGAGGVGGSGGNGGTIGTGGAGGGGGEGGAGPLGATVCDDLSLDFGEDDISDEIAGTPWTLGGDGNADSGGGVLTMDGDDELIYLVTAGAPMSGCSVTATVTVPTYIESYALAFLAAQADFGDATARGMYISLSGENTCFIEFGLNDPSRDAPGRACTLPLTVRLRHTGAAEVCYDVLDAGGFEEVACGAAPDDVDVILGVTSNDAFELDFGPIQ